MKNGEMGRAHRFTDARRNIYICTWKAIMPNGFAAADHPYGFVPFLITVFHLKSPPPYHETSCISLFMYEKWFKAARESSSGRKYE